MRIASDKKSIWGIITVIVFTDLIVLLLFPFYTVPVIQTMFSILVVIFIDIFLLIFMLHEYKTFDFENNVLTIRYSFLKFLNAIVIHTDDVEKIRIIRYSIQNRIAPVMIISSLIDNTRSNEKKIKFRFENKRIEFQDFINDLRDKGIKVECEGDVWF